MHGSFEASTVDGMLVSGGRTALAALRDSRIVFANAAFDTLFGRPCVGRALADLVAEQDARSLDAVLAGGSNQGSVRCSAEPAAGLLLELELDLHQITLDDGQIWMVVADNVTQRRRDEERISYLAFSDALTGLSNRAYFADRLRQSLLDFRRSGVCFGVLVADLDGFKRVNDRYGHEVGDIALQIVAQRLLACVRLTDTLARRGGDEFTALLSHLRGAEDASIVAGRMVRALDEPLAIDGHVCEIGISVGIAIFPEHATSTDAVMVAADSALYRAKKEGGRRFAWADPVTESEVVRVAFLSWSPVYEVDVARIDDAHMHLLYLLNRLGDELKQGRERECIQATFVELVGCAEAHFAEEERLMLEHGLPGYQDHRQAHQWLLDDIKSLAVGLDMRSMYLTMRYLQDWLFRHIDGMDRTLAQALSRAGVG